MVKGMVTRISDVKPQVSVVTYTCDSCGSEIYQEITGTQFRPLDKCPSRRCTDNDAVGKLQMQTRGSRFVKYQVRFRWDGMKGAVDIAVTDAGMALH
jgi:DNA replication licensing factor MCM7